MATITNPPSAPPSSDGGPSRRLAPPLVTAAALGMLFEGRHSLRIVVDCIKPCEIQHGAQLISCAWKLDDVSFSALELHGALLVIAILTVAFGLVQILRKKP